MYGIVDYVGFIEVGKLVDICFWKFVMFGVKFEIVIKGGAIVWV